MFLSGMGMGRLQCCLVALALATLWVSAAAADASADCKTGVVRDYTGFIAGLPPLPTPPIDERLPFAPERTFFHGPLGGALQVGAGERYYSLSYSPSTGNPAPAPLDWKVTTTLTPIDEMGKALGPSRIDEQRVSEVWPAGDGGANVLRFGFEISDAPAVYRLDLRIENGAGEQLATFGEYFRVLPPSFDLRLALNRTRFKPGQRLRATLSNYGVASYGYGYPWVVQYRRDGSWTRPPVGFTPGPFLMPLFSLPPGGSTSCWSAEIPRDAPPGRYRFGIRVTGGPSFRLPSRWQPLYAGFTILPRRKFAVNTAAGRRTSRPAA